jgi:hypothetical protein
MRTSQTIRLTVFQLVCLMAITILSMNSIAKGETVHDEPSCSNASIVTLLSQIQILSKVKEQQPEVDASDIVQRYILPDCDIVTVITHLANAEFRLTVSQKNPNKVFASFILENWWISSRDFRITIEYSFGKVKSVSGSISTNSL